MSLEPQGQIYRQKKNPVIFFHVFIVTVKIGLLLSIWRHFYCSPFLLCPQAHGDTAEASQAWDSMQSIACVESFLLPGFPG